MLPPRGLNALTGYLSAPSQEGYGSVPPVNALAALMRQFTAPGLSDGMPFPPQAQMPAWPPLTMQAPPPMQPLMKIDATGSGPPVVSVLRGHEALLEGNGPSGLGTWADGGTYAPSRKKADSAGQWRPRPDLPLSPPPPAWGRK